MRLLYLGCVLLLAACDSGAEVQFAQPFPPAAPNLTAFAAKHQGMYLATGNPALRLHIGRQAIWSEAYRSQRVARRQLDSLGLSKQPADGKRRVTAQGRTYRLQPDGVDTLRWEEWVQDTVCLLGLGEETQARWHQGAYYLNTPEGNYWTVQRLVFTGRQLSWQALGQDTLRIAALPAGVVRRTTEEGNVHWLLQPVRKAQVRQIIRYAGLWQELQTFERQ